MLSTGGIKILLTPQKQKAVHKQELEGETILNLRGSRTKKQKRSSKKKSSKAKGECGKRYERT